MFGVIGVCECVCVSEGTTVRAFGKELVNILG